MNSDDGAYFMEKHAFAQFANEPITQHTLSLLRFALKPFLMRLTVYGAIPEDKWTPPVQRILLRTLLRHEREIIFLPIIRPALPLFARFIRRRPRAFLPTYRSLKKRTVAAAMGPDQRRIRNAIIIFYERHTLPSPPILARDVGRIN